MKHDLIKKEELTKLLEEVIREYEKTIGESVSIDQTTSNLILDIVVEIYKLKIGKWTSIAELIEYNPEILFISPLKQGTITLYSRKICEKIGIELIKDNSFGGLAFMQKFKKVKSKI